MIEEARGMFGAAGALGALEVPVASGAPVARGARQMRRKDRELSGEAAMEILAGGRYGVMALVDEDNFPYGVPLHYVLIDGAVYFHSAIHGGYKAECFAGGGRAGFTVVESEDGIKARSVIIFGTIEVVPDMRTVVLEKFVEKFVPPFAWEQAKAGVPYAQDGIMAYRLNAEYMTAKFVDRPEQG